MPTILNGDVPIHFEVTGSGAPLVLIMGLGADNSAWDLHRRVYADHFQCVAIDNRGVGGSGKPAGPCTTATMADDARAVMDHLSIDAAHVSGISMGGAIAQHLCLANPGRVQSLTLVSTFARLPAFGRSVFEHFKAVRAHVAPEDFSRCIQLWIWGEAHTELHGLELAETRAQVARNPAPQPDNAFAAQCDACIGHDALGRLGEIDAPKLVTVGDKDIFTPPHLARELAEGIAGARLVTFENCAHAHHWEAIDRFNATTLDFLLSH